ncbi:MAG: hypothetical protein WAU91_20335 [Desulfatitalea sp.]
MKHFGSIQRLCMGGWLLAAVILAWVNGLYFMALENEPMKGDPAAIRALRMKLSRLEGVAADSARYLIGQDDTQGFFAAYRIPQSGPATPSVTAAAGGSASVAVAAGGVPVLTGILQVLDPPGAPYFLAVLNGRVCREQDQVSEFTVGKISAEGVALHRPDGRWFIESPRPYYTSDQGK